MTWVTPTCRLAALRVLIRVHVLYTRAVTFTCHAARIWLILVTVWHGVRLAQRLVQWVSAVHLAPSQGTVFKPNTNPTMFYLPIFFHRDSHFGTVRVD